MPEAVVKAQCDAIRHRGPDDAGVLVEGDFGFGMRRLSILDLAGGHQPMVSPDGRYATVFNGEIFNHRDLRGPLNDAGWTFRTHSDTETILAAYANWGDDAWAMLEGMFAVAIWDRRLRRLTLARDPVGIKPLYYSEQAGGLSFGSELKTLRMVPGHAFDVDDLAVNDLFTFGHVRHPRTIFRQVQMLAPGHFLTMDGDGAATCSAYWQPRFSIEQGVSTDDWVERMRDMLMQTTARHMQSDVPVGAFLSGGIDSSAVLAAMTRTAGQPVKAFTIGHPGSRIDETEAASEIARHLGAEHVAMPLEMHDAVGMLPRIVGCYDEPFADLAAIPTWYASRLAAQHVKVVLCGEGGDELFAGYKRHRNAYLIERSRPFYGALHPLARGIGRLTPTGSRRLNRLIQHARRAAEFVQLDDGYQQFFAATSISRRDLRRALYTPEFRRRTEAADDPIALERTCFAGRNTGAGSALEEFMFADLTLNMPSAMLTRLDRASMAHSLEARVPFLSHRMVDWAMTVPDEMKLRGTTGKYIVRRTVAPLLPRSVMTRPKQGFQIPHAAWLRGAFGRFAQDVWHDSGAAATGYLDVAAVDRLFEEHRAGKADHARLLYAIAVFAIWWRDSMKLLPS